MNEITAEYEKDTKKQHFWR